jgi:hypothetical protein
VDDEVGAGAQHRHGRGQPAVVTLTAKGGDTVTAMGKRNISLVAGGLARAVIGPAISHTPELVSMYLPEPGRAPQLVAERSSCSRLAPGARCGVADLRYRPRSWTWDSRAAP